MDCGLLSSENAGMSSERGVRISPAGWLRIPGPRSSSPGESGPKARPTGVVEWKKESIFSYRRLTDQRTRKAKPGTEGHKEGFGLPRAPRPGPSDPCPNAGVVQKGSRARRWLSVFKRVGRRAGKPTLFMAQAR